MGATGKFLVIGLFVILCLIGLGQSVQTYTSLKRWFKVACIAEHLKDNDHYICDSHGYIHCLPGWSNEFKGCKVPICHPKCSTHGHCTKPNTCTCDIGWTGGNCSQCVVLPGCHNGGCHFPFDCNCHDGYEGMLCDKPICKAGCRHGHCTIPGECICHPGWEGPLCDKCIKLPGCSKFGTCNKPLECICPDGYQGNFCGKPICRPGCHQQYGYCDRPGDCWCRPGWTGQNCTICDKYPGCVNGGCDQPWECNCNPGYHGKLCDKPGDGTTTISPYDHNPGHDVKRASHDDTQFPQELVEGLQTGFFDLQTANPQETEQDISDQVAEIGLVGNLRPAELKTPEKEFTEPEPNTIIDTAKVQAPIGDQPFFADEPTKPTTAPPENL